MTSTTARLAATLALSLSADAFAAPQMYKCVENGRTVYQQQACNPQPQVESATGTVHPPASAASSASSATTTKLRRPSPASSVPATPR